MDGQPNERAAPHDGAQTQMDHDPDRTPSARDAGSGAADSGDSGTGAPEPTVPEATTPAIAAPGKPDGEVDTRR